MARKLKVEKTFVVKIYYNPAFFVRKLISKKITN